MFGVLFGLSLGARRRAEHDMGARRNALRTLPTNRRENPMTTTSLTPDTNELRRFSGLPTELALPHAAPFLARLVKDPDFVESEILPLLEEARHREGW
jgi:hypothetical protein